MKSREKSVERSQQSSETMALSILIFDYIISTPPRKRILTLKLPLKMLTGTAPRRWAAGRVEVGLGR